MERKYMDTYTTQANGECYFLLGVRYRRSGPWRSCYHLALLVVSVALFVTWKFVVDNTGVDRCIDRGSANT